jgi:hypothetical protein
MTTSGAGKKPVGVTAASTTLIAAVTTADDETAVTPRRKRHYKPRARRCACCGESFTPQRRGKSKYCSDLCRGRDWRRKHPKKQAAADLELEAITCEHCGKGALVPAGKGRRYCDATCRTAAYRARREAAIAALIDGHGMSQYEAVATVESKGMQRVTRMLNTFGYVYDADGRRWLMPVNEQAFVRQESS